ncbi:glycosyltransferase [Kosmotoga pacifica]|uniref:Glycosyl transferase family 1 domain-containing protein n=1 Tax=Kosmotoga pacifica TaxID=1330330 RepID=A0A0G2Z8X8_9BACT|nr:glycosyltransferase [Kosmotoga pacifica]AKI96526.1 hypothetical protein IX53_00335 [Kosmotoga pacifica]
MKKTILLISNHFPFSPGEEFLKVEVDILSEYFDIILAPMNATGKRRDVPDNVVVCGTLAKRIAKLSTNKLQRVLKSISELRHKIEIIREISKNLYFPRKLAEIINYSAIGNEIVNWFEEEYSQKKIKVNILYSYWLLYAAYGVLKIKAKHKEVVCVTRAHGSDLYSYASNRYLPLREYILSNIDKVFCVSEHGKSYLSSLFPQYADKVAVSRLGTLDPKIVNEGSKDGKFRAVSCSSLVTVKRVKLIIKAISYVSKRTCKEIVWTHIGDGPQRKQLEEFARFELGKKNVKYEFAGQLPHDHVLSYYSSNPVDVFINTSSSEGLPVSIMEAMSYGIPVIATDVGGTSEIVGEDNGFILNKDVSAKEIGEMLFRFINEDHNKIAAKRKNTRKKWGVGFNAQKNFTQFSSELLGMCS